MAWPSYVSPGQTIVSAQYNALVDALETWGGTVNAGGYGVSNLTGITLAANATLDATAGGFQVKGPTVFGFGNVTVNADVTINSNTGNGLTVATPGARSLTIYTAADANYPQFINPTNGLVVRSMDGVRAIRLLVTVAPVVTETISTASGRLHIAGGLDVDADIKMTSLAVSGAITAAGITLSPGGVVCAGDCYIGGTLSTSRADGYLYIAPWTRITSIYATGNINCCSADYTKIGSFWYNTTTLQPTLTSNTGQIRCDVSFLAVSASGIQIYSPDLTRYLQISCANAANPSLGSSTGYLLINPATTFAAGVAISTTLNVNGGVAFGAGLTVTAGGLTVTGGTTFGGGQIVMNGVLQMYANIGMNSGSALYIYSASNAQSMILGFSGTTPTITATSTISVNTGIAAASLSATGRVAAGVDLYVGPSLTGTGYLQLCNNGQFSRPNPWIYSSTAVLDMMTAVYISGGLQAMGTVTFSGAMTCAGGATFSANLDASGPSASLRALNNASLVWYNAGNANYGVCGWNGANPAIGSSTGAFYFNGTNLVIGSSTGGTGVTLNLAASADSNMAVGMVGSPGLGVIIGVSNNINNGMKGYISSPGQLNISSPVTYHTGSVSATAHTTHGSGTDIADVYKSFLRREEVKAFEGDLSGPIVPVNGWALAPADDGMHILCKRAEGVFEFILPWSDARKVTG